MPNWKKLIVSGSDASLNSLNLSSVVNAGTDTDKFLVLDSSGNVDFRTGANVLSDIGGQASGVYVSESAQIDHDQTTNFVAGEHFLQSAITTVGTVTTGDVSAILPDGTVSGSSQITGFVSDNGGATGEVAVWSSGTAISGSNSLFFDTANNRLGIGTSSPSNTLHIVRESANVTLKLNRTGTNSGATDFVVGNGGKLNVNGDSFISLNADSYVKFNANGSERMRIESDGTIGIGTTSPTQKLDVRGNILISGSSNALFIKGDGSKQAKFSHDGAGLTIEPITQNQDLSLGSTSCRFPSGIKHYGGAHIFHTGSASGEAARIDKETGYLGIGTSSPDEALTVVGNISASGEIQTNNNFIVDSNGRVGINTLSPDYKLDVSGNAGINEYLYHNGDTDTYLRYQNNQVDIAAGGQVASLTTTELTLPGSLTVGGTVTAQEFHTEFVSASIVFQSGSTKFGDTTDDIHSFTGSLNVTGSLNLSSVVNAGTDTDKFLVLDSDGNVDFRTGANVLTDIGGQASGNYVTDAGGAVCQVAVWSSGTAISGSNDLFFNTANNRLGIGTSSPTQELDVNGNVKGTVAMFDTLNNSANSANIIYRTGTTTAIGGGATLNKVYVLDNGCVGIGKASPSVPLEIADSDNTLLYLSSSTANVYLRLDDNTSTNGNFIGATGNEMHFWTNNTRAATIDGSQCVGIGTTSPAEKLTVAGNISGSGCIQIGTGHTNSGTLASIAGGTAHIISSGHCSFIGGGNLNFINNEESAIVGGKQNCVCAQQSFIGAGNQHTICSRRSIIVGGRRNCITDSTAECSVLVGGSNHILEYGLNATMVGGDCNVVSGSCSFLGGGAFNKVDSDVSVIVGGTLNTGSGACGFIGGGSCNNICSGEVNAVIGGGRNNLVDGDCSSILGGLNNCIVNFNSVIAGGCNNTVCGYLSFVGGGQCNIICNATNWSVIGGGCCNIILGCVNNTIGGGNNNCILTYQYGSSNVIAGGNFNLISGSSSESNNTIAGGFTNHIIQGACRSAIGGGCKNKITDDVIVIAGGCSNTGSGACSGILGGKNNYVNHANSMIIGSDLTSDKACYTFMNNLDVEGTVSGSVFSGSFVGDGSGLTGISGGGSIDGSGAANKLAIWSDSDTLTSDTCLHWDTANNRLGIGVTSPSCTLHVGGSILACSNLFTEVAVDQTDSGKIRMAVSSTTAEGFIMVRNDGAGHVAADPEFKILFNDTEKFRFDNQGLGIGVTSPAANLDVSGSNVSGKSLQLRSGDINTGTDSAQIIFAYNGNSWNSNGYAHTIRTRHHSNCTSCNAIDFYTWTPSDSANVLGTKRVMTIDGPGYVGINCTSRQAIFGCEPSLRVASGSGQPGVLDIHGIGQASDGDLVGLLQFSNSNDSNYTIGQIIGEQAGSAGSGNSGGGHLVFKTNGGGSGVSPSERMRITDSGKVGIGCNAPVACLQVGNGTTDPSARVYYSDASYTELRGYGLEFNRTTSYLRPTADNNATLNIGQSSKQWNTINIDSSTTIFETNGTENGRINSSGNFGLGTGSSIDEKLHVQGSANNDDIAIKIENTFDDNNASSAPTAALVFSAASNNGYMRVHGAPADTAANHKIDIGATASNSFITFSPSTTEKMRITAAGLVGIGTDSPDALLHVSSGTSGDATVIIEADTDNNAEGDVPRLWFKADGDITEGALQLNDNELELISNVDSAGGIVFKTGTTNNTGTTDPATGATERMRITSAGKVGIGEDDPAQALHVIGRGLFATGGSTPDATTGTYEKGITLTGGNMRLVMDTSDVTNGGSYIQTRHSSTSFPSAYYRLHLNPLGGGVGINAGTLAPTGSLHVEGPGYFKGGSVNVGDSVSTAAIVMDCNTCILGRYNGQYLRTIIGTDNANNICIGQNGTSLIHEINLKPGTSGGCVRIYNDNTEYARFTNSKFGIGTTDPQATLHADYGSTVAPSLTFGATAGQILQNENSEFAFGLHNASPYPLWIQGRTNANTARNITLQPLGGNIGIGTYSPSTLLDVDGTTTTVTLVETSTKELKEDIQPLDSQLENLKKLKPIEFAWKKDKKKDFGLLAEDVEKVYPYLVEHDEEDKLIGVKYSKLTSVLVKALQEQQEQIDELKEEIKVLKQK